MKTIFVITFLLTATGLGAQTSPVDWQALARYQGSAVRLTLKDGATVRGRLERVDAAGLTLEGRSAALSPAGLRLFEVNRPTRRWRIIGAVAGGAVGFAASLGTAIAINGIGVGFGPGSNHTNVAAPVAVGAGVTAAGFLIGWRADRHWVPLTLAPSAAPQPKTAHTP